MCVQPGAAARGGFRAARFRASLHKDAQRGAAGMPWNGSAAHREALRLALRAVREEKRIADITVAEAAAEYNRRQTAYPELKGVTIDRATVNRWRRGEAGALDQANSRKAMLLFNFLEESPSYWTRHVNGGRANIPPDAPNFGVLSLFKSLGIPVFSEEYNALRSLAGDYAVFRRCWLHPERYDLAVVSHLHIFESGNLMFGAESQAYVDPVSKMEISEKDEGVLFGYGGNVFFVSVEKSALSFKFFVFHSCYPLPTGSNRVQQLEGNMIGACGRGPHPGYPVFGRRGQASAIRSGILTYAEVPDDIRARIGLRNPDG